MKTTALKSIAPSFPQSPGDKAAHDKAMHLLPVGREKVRQARATEQDSDPIMDEALRRVRDHRDALREGLAAARAYAASAAA